MKMFLKFFAVTVVMVAMVACGGGDGTTDTGGTDNGGTDVCTPACDGKVCGDDGCGGECGTCDAGKKCSDDQTECEDCTADCTDKICGDDGCGGTCDPGCGADEMCAADQKSCDCKPDCDGKDCGDDGCGGECGPCTGGKACIANKCEDCTPDCAGKDCGDDGCGDSCGTCTAFGKLATCDADGMCQCTADCGTAVCGDDGCAGSCGDCPVDTECYMGECVGPCTLPDAWDPVGVVLSLQSPADATVVADMCPDFSGDAKGDNGLKALASMINPELEKALTGGEMGILFEFLGVDATPEDFILVGQVGEPKEVDSTEFLIEAAGYDPLCEPVISFPNSSITGGELAAGPSIFTLDLAAMGVDEVPLVLSIGDTQISGTVTATGADGVVVESGVLAGVLTKELVEEALATAEVACDVPNPESFCSYLSVAKQFLPMLFDLDLEPAGAPDGVKDAASVCFQYTLGKATIAGYKPE